MINKSPSLTGFKLHYVTYLVYNLHTYILRLTYFYIFTLCTFTIVLYHKAA